MMEEGPVRQGKTRQEIETRDKTEVLMDDLEGEGCNLSNLGVYSLTYLNTLIWEGEREHVQVISSIISNNNQRTPKKKKRRRKEEEREKRH